MQNISKCSRRDFSKYKNEEQRGFCNQKTLLEYLRAFYTIASQNHKYFGIKTEMMNLPVSRCDF